MTYQDCPYSGRVFKDAKSVPMEQWRWPNFTPKELACKGTGKVLIDARSMDMLQRLRTDLGRPIVLNSAYRSPAHNKKVGGAKGSYHLQARAFDCKMTDFDPQEFEAAARSVGFTGFGYYPPKGNGYNFIHIDTGPARSWGTRWTVSEPANTNSAPDPKPTKRRKRFRF